MPDLLPPRDPHSRFVNWSGRVTSTPTAWLGPRTEAEVVDLVTRAHWGKELDHTAKQVASLYPRLGDFRALRDQLDPDRVFGGPFLTQVLGD